METFTILPDLCLKKVKGFPPYDRTFFNLISLLSQLAKCCPLTLNEFVQNAQIVHMSQDTCPHYIASVAA